MQNTDKNRIAEIKKEILTFEIVRPGNLTKQKRGTKDNKYNYLSYTYKNKGKTEYIKGKYVQKIQKEIEDYNKFKNLINEWIDLSIKISKLEMK